MAAGLGSVRTADEVADHFRTLIRSGELGVGDRLPPQRALARQLGIGRQAVFEGLGALEAEGYVDTVRGSRGGTFVAELDRPAQRWLTHLRSNIGELDDVLDFRIGVERQIASLAAARRTSADLADMGDAIAQQRHATTKAAYRVADAAFHRALAAAARNELLGRAVFEARAALFFPVDQLPYAPTFSATAREHDRIMRAVERHDSAGAARAVVDHLEHTRGKLHSLLAEPIPNPSRTISKDNP